MRYLTHHTHRAFLSVMQLILAKMDTPQIQSNYWARSLQEIVKLKTELNTSTGGSDFVPQEDVLVETNKKIANNFQRFLQKCQRTRSKLYKQKLFEVCLHQLNQDLSFTESVKIIGNTLKANFDEICNESRSRNPPTG